LKALPLLTILALCLAITGCEQASQQENPQHTQKHTQMKQLTIILEHAITMMAQGAELKRLGQQQGDLMLVQSADLLRRAMSGTEMSEMHKAGGAHSPDMQYTHDLGAAAFDLLDLMMVLDKQPQGTSLLHHALSMAAEGSNLKSLADMAMSSELHQVMQQQGHSLQQASMHLPQTLTHKETYSQAVFKVIKLLTHHTPKGMPETH